MLIGRRDDAEALFERLLSIRNDVGLLAEEYDPRAGRQVGNFPQAFSHIGLINAAYNLSRADKPSEQRAELAAAEERLSRNVACSTGWSRTAAASHRCR